MNIDRLKQKKTFVSKVSFTRLRFPLRVYRLGVWPFRRIDTLLNDIVTGTYIV